MRRLVVLAVVLAVAAGAAWAPPISPPPAAHASGALFSDDFETGGLTPRWASVAGLVVQPQEVFAGRYAARAAAAAGPARYARAPLPAPQSDVYYRLRFKIVSRAANTFNLLKFRTTTGSVLSFGVNNLGNLAYRNDVAGASTNSTVAVGPGWHEIQVRVRVAGENGQIEVWYEGVRIAALSKAENFGTAPVGVLQLGENTPGLTYDAAFDEIETDVRLITPTQDPATPTTSPTPTSTPSPTPAGGDPVVLAAGDIACGRTSVGGACVQMATSDLVLSRRSDAVLALGDVQYECADLADFAGSFDPSWGRFKSRIRPAVGNHEYSYHNAAAPTPTGTPRSRLCDHTTDGARDYWAYFGPAASPQDPDCAVFCKGYYSFELGSWHVVAINSTCRPDGCGKGSRQEQWLRADLAAHPAPCTLAYWHHPRFSSGPQGSNASMDAIWRALYEHDADVILSGHDHSYERFLPQDPDARLDPVRGILQIVVGTGGRNVSSFFPRGTLKANSHVRNDQTFGVLALTLHATSYDWEFLPIVGPGSTFTDRGSGACH